MDRMDFMQLARAIADGQHLENDAAYSLADWPAAQVWELLPGADWLRQRHFGDGVRTCTILNAKSGRCSENCGFCSQSAHARTDAPVYPLMDSGPIVEAAQRANDAGIGRFSVVTSGRGLPTPEVERLAQSMAQAPKGATGYCASLGILGAEELGTLRASGVTRYHHNLETARTFFPQMCTTHTFDERVDTLKAAKAAGMSLCSGGIFGIGESDRQVVELALELRGIGVDAVPVNFVIPIEGTRQAGQGRPSALRCLKILAIFRYILPWTDILVCGGRENLGELHPLIFMAGANGIMTGNYLTRDGRQVEQDRRLLQDMGLRSM